MDFLGPIAKVVSGVWDRFFSKEVVEKNRRKQLKRLEDEFEELLQKADSPDNRKHIADILKRIKRMQDDFSA